MELAASCTVPCCVVLCCVVFALASSVLFDSFESSVTMHRLSFLFVLVVFGLVSWQSLMGLAIFDMVVFDLLAQAAQISPQ